MSTETTNLKLNKPDKTDFYSIDLVNTNMDKIDEAVTGKASKDDIPKSLPANGGNADTVGGKLPSAFAPVGHTHSKADVGLGNVDNTADASKNVNYANSAGSAVNAANANYATNANYANGAGVSNTTNQLSVTSGAPASPFAGQLWIW